MQRKEGHKYRLNGRGRRKISERKLSNYFSDLFSTYRDSWYNYVNVCSTMYTEFIRNTSKMAECWLDSFSKFWSGQYKVKIKVEQFVSGMFAPPPQDIFIPIDVIRFG
jgi:hypothetical protein